MPAPVLMSAPALWLLFALAGIAFAWGASGAAVSLAGYRRPLRVVPVVFLVPFTPGWPPRQGFTAADRFAATVTAAVAS